MAADHAPLLDGESGVVPISVATPEKHYALLRAPSGRYLASGGDDGGLRLAHWAEDAALWSEAISASSSVFTNLVSGATVSGSLDAGVCEDAGSEPDHGRAFQLRSDGAVLGDDGTADGGWGAVFLAQHGPAHAPSEYLRQIREEGCECSRSAAFPFKSLNRRWRRGLHAGPCASRDPQEAASARGGVRHAGAAPRAHGPRLDAAALPTLLSHREAGHGSDRDVGAAPVPADAGRQLRPRPLHPHRLPAG